MKSYTTKILAGLAVVGTVAAIALMSMKDNSSSVDRFLASDNASNEDQQAFQEFVNKYNRNYLTKDEYNARLSIFRSNLEKVKNHNSEKEGYSIALNKFSDLSEAEFNNLLGLKAPSVEFHDGEEEPEVLGASMLGANPTSVDWRSSGAVTGVKNQGSCGSCYTFSAVAAMEGVYKIKTGSLVDFSEQQLLDCTSGYGNMGCSGGLMTNCFKYLRSYKLQKDSTYPYTGIKSTCKYNSANGVTNAISYTTVTSKSTAALETAIARGPVSVAVQANASVFQLYRSGVISSTSCGTSLNHGVTAVGYGTANGQAYWIVKNSWGSNWGESGYFRVLKSTTYDSVGGICGILLMSSQPTV